MTACFLGRRTFLRRACERSRASRLGKVIAARKLILGENLRDILRPILLAKVYA
jgi:hypothetical protein